MNNLIINEVDFFKEPRTFIDKISNKYTRYPSQMSTFDHFFFIGNY